MPILDIRLSTPRTGAARRAVAVDVAQPQRVAGRPASRRAAA